MVTLFTNLCFPPFSLQTYKPTNDALEDILRGLRQQAWDVFGRRQCEFISIILSQSSENECDCKWIILNPNLGRTNANRTAGVKEIC